MSFLISISIITKDIDKKLTKWIRRHHIHISMFIIIFTAFYTGRYTYITLNSKDLFYAVEYNLTHGHNSKQLMRVQNLTLISKNHTTAVVEATGLSQSVPHKTITIRASFKNCHNLWQLDTIY